jgi:replicative DNA helicase
MAFSSALTDALDMASRAYERQGGLSGISTGLRDLDRSLGGLQSSDLIILAGRPSMGKTALVTNIAFNVAKAYRTETNASGEEEVADGAVVGFFSLEMSSEQLATRIVAEQGQISSEKIRRGLISEDEFHRLVKVTQELQSLPLFIDHTGGISIAQLAARARKLKRQRGLGLLIVDYLQLLSGSGKRSSDSRVNEITEITTGLKALAKELQVPVIALSQLSRQVENREDKRPQLSDLRESGSIEQDADVVMFVFREEYYVQRSEPSVTKVEDHQKWQDMMDQVAGLAEVVIGKQRHGPTGTVRLQFTAEHTRFSDLADDRRLPEQTY